ncbi:ELYS-like domain-containing protein, partial [Mrakia frigida]|uniref:ELYS family protein n=1 Tax=Mrakia frigida TaxID=29902 RepID=UPI003FCC1F09
YPPQDILSLRRLLGAIQISSFDKLKKDCLVYYLLKDSEEGGGTGRATRFAEERLIPSQFVDLTDGYWAMDNGLCELAVSRLSSISVKPDFTSKILLTLSKIPSPPSSNPNITSDSLSARLVLYFIRFARPTIDSPQDVHIKLDALAKTSIREAWMYMRTFEEGEFRAGLIRRVFQFCLTR